jgi:hypothetical protein
LGPRGKSDIGVERLRVLPEPQVIADGQAGTSPDIRIKLGHMPRNRRREQRASKIKRQHGRSNGTPSTTNVDRKSLIAPNR